MRIIDRVDEMLNTLTEFRDLLNEETLAVNDNNTRIIGQLAERKDLLSRSYQRQLKIMADCRHDLVNLEVGLKKRLEEAWEDFEIALKKNLQANEVARYASSRVVEMIVNAVRKASGSNGFNPYGVTMGKTKGPVTCSPLTLNRVL